MGTRLESGAEPPLYGRARPSGESQPLHPQRCDKAGRAEMHPSQKTCLDCVLHRAFVGKGRDKAQENDCAAGDDISGGTAVFSSAAPRFQSVQKACGHKEVYFDAAE